MLGHVTNITYSAASQSILVQTRRTPHSGRHFIPQISYDTKAWQRDGFRLEIFWDINTGLIHAIAS